jgi:hypothetical protein
MCVEAAGYTECMILQAAAQPCSAILLLAMAPAVICAFCVRQELCYTIWLSCGSCGDVCCLWLQAVEYGGCREQPGNREGCLTGLQDS